MNLNDKDLLSETKRLRGKEKSILFALLLHLGELDERKLYRDEGYPSFYAYLTEALGYSNSSAQRRIEASRFLRKQPELYQELTSGTLSFSALVELSKCGERENLSELVEESKGKCFKEVSELVQKEVAPVVPARRKERVRIVKQKPVVSTPLLGEPTTTDAVVAYEVAFQADEEFMALYQEAKAVSGGFSMKEVFQKVLADYTKRKSPKEKIKRRKARSPKDSSPSPQTRHIPTATKDEVHVRDGGRCTYTSPDGTRCNCEHNLEYDHIYPYSLDGESTPQNLRLLCRAHNQLMAERTFGKSFMQSKLLPMRK